MEQRQCCSGIEVVRKVVTTASVAAVVSSFKEQCVHWGCVSLISGFQNNGNCRLTAYKRQTTKHDMPEIWNRFVNLILESQPDDGRVAIRNKKNLKTCACPGVNGTLALAHTFIKIQGAKLVKYESGLWACVFSKILDIARCRVSSFKCQMTHASRSKHSYWQDVHQMYD